MDLHINRYNPGRLEGAVKGTVPLGSGQAQRGGGRGPSPYVMSFLLPTAQ